MAKSRNIQRISNKKRGKPKVRFSFWGMIIIFALSFAACFILYLVSANLNDNFLNEEFDNIIVEEESDAGEEDGNTPVDEETEQNNVPDAPDVTNPIPQSAAVDASYFENCCLVTDSTLLDIGNHTDIKDIIGSEQLNAATCNTTKVASSYGTVTVYETLQIKKPMNVYIMLGSDIGVTPVDEMIENYRTLVSNLHAFRPEMHIYIMQLPPVSAVEGSAVTNELVNEYNTKLLDLANKIGVYCIDTNTALKSVDGSISAEFISEETGEYTEAAYQTIAGYILTHTV